MRDYRLQPTGSPHRVRVKTGTGVKRAWALVYGQVAIHRWGRDEWHLTYIGNGSNILTAKIVAQSTPCILIETAKAIQSLFDDVPEDGKNPDNPYYTLWLIRSKELIDPWQKLIDSETEK